VGILFIVFTVDVVYDPADISELTIEYDGHPPWMVRELVIGERAGKRPSLPEHLGPQPADASRLLNAAEERNHERQKQHAPAVSYRRVVREDSHV
jgi:putative transposase